MLADPRYDETLGEIFNLNLRDVSFSKRRFARARLRVCRGQSGSRYVPSSVGKYLTATSVLSSKYPISPTSKVWRGG